jgi:hypothetical protein
MVENSRQLQSQRESTQKLGRMPGCIADFEELVVSESRGNWKACHLLHMLHRSRKLSTKEVTETPGRQDAQ